MRLSNHSKYFIILLLGLFTAAATPVEANINPRNLKAETNTKEDPDQQVKPVKETEPKQLDQKQSTEKNDQEDEGSDVTKSSFNYLFYLIYKVKFEDVFNFPDRRSPRNSASLDLINMNSLLDHLVQPKL